MHERTFSRIAPRRAKLFFYVVVILSGFLVAKLYDVQVLRGPVLAKQAFEQRSDVVEVFGRRGSILDRDGNVLVRSLPSESVYAIPREVGNPHTTYALLKRILPHPDPQLISVLERRSSQFFWVERKVPHETAQRISALALPGIGIKEEDTGLRYDTVGHLASTVLGFVGIDENGLDGVEYAFDPLLRGTSGRTILEADQFGRTIPFGEATVVKPARAGFDVQLTIDSYLQYETERALAQQVHEFSAVSGSAVVMNPYTGEILALANVPDYEPNSYLRFGEDARRNRAVMDAYEPGSTFKLITAAAALQSGKLRPNSRFPARDTLTVGGHTIHNAEDGFMAGTGGSESMEDIVALSHNVGAAEIGMAIGKARFYAMMRSMGFGAETALGLPGENPGIVLPLNEWSGTSLATMSFGHGVSVTPVGLARAYCAIVNGGILLRPQILSAILGLDGHVVYRYGTQVEHRVLSGRTAASLRTFMRAVVLRGTGKPTAQVPGYSTAGKTGTAQVVENGHYAPGEYIASFVGFVPYEHPRFVILVKVEKPRSAIYGSVVAAPAFAQIAHAAMLHAGVLPVSTPAPTTRPARLVNASSTTK
ncbi:MAG: penicillin-binding protein 2 [Candidatus Eremiobacteraeota bacterium]|nr:penicillin-binding protein 2 [Candidatus Eremiobacteraeota bacterium]